MNRDTLYSSIVIDLDAGPAAITLPDAGKRYMTMQLVSEDAHSPPAHHWPNPYTITRQKVGTRNVIVGIRTLVNLADLKAVRALQDSIKVDQPGGPEKLEFPNWESVSQKKVRDALLVMNATLTDTSRGFGLKEEVDPVVDLTGRTQ